jgi:hypothetical protein
MPGFKGKRKRGLTLTLYKKPFRYRLPVSPPLKGYKYFEIERDFFNKLGVPIDGDFKFGVLLLVFVRFLGGDTGNLYRNGLLSQNQSSHEKHDENCDTPTFLRCS